MEITCGCKSMWVKDIDQAFLIVFGAADAAQGLVHTRHSEPDHTQSSKVLWPILGVATGDCSARIAWSISGDRPRSGVLLKILKCTRQAPQQRCKEG